MAVASTVVGLAATLAGCDGAVTTAPRALDKQALLSSWPGGSFVITKANVGGHPYLTVSFPSGASSARLVLYTYYQELNDEEMQTWQEWRETLHHFETWDGAGRTFHHTTRAWTGYVACGTPAAWHQPFEATYYELHVEYPDGSTGFERVQAPIMEQGSYHECWTS